MSLTSPLQSQSQTSLAIQIRMDLEQHIREYKDKDTEVSSPIWICFDKCDTNASCKICKTNVPRKDGSTGGLFQYSIFPATQNKDDRLFSLVGRNTGPLSRRIKIETIEKKVVVGSAIQKHGFIFDHQKGHKSSSSDDESF